jgi:hypothetical protein
VTQTTGWGEAQQLPSAIGDPWYWVERANTVPVTASGLVAGRRSFITGFSFTETTGTATASVQLITGQTAGGILLATINLAISESAREYLPWPWLLAKYGIFVNVASGAVAGSVSSLTVPES